MYVSKIRMQNFRCYTDFTMQFSPKVTVIVAENGRGKTAILDGLAITMAPYLAAFPGIKARNFQPNDVRMVVDVPQTQDELQIKRMKYLLPVVLETEVKADDGKAYSWKRELKSVKGKTSSVSAKFVSDYGKRIADELNQPGDQDIILPVLGYYGTSRMWNDSSLLKRKKVDLSRSSGYVECLEPSGSYNTFAQWFRYATESALEYDHIIAEKKLNKKNPYREILNAINKAIVTCIQSMGWTDLKYSFAAQNLLICHPEKGELPLEAMSDGARSVISMAADIAYRMARLNPDMGEDVTLKTSGVVLIDEVDMHLHPSWQQTVVNDLVKAFPKVQFIVTTHSPQVLTSVPAECIRILHWDNDLVDIEEPTFSLGAESSQLLRDIQHVESRPGSLPIVQALQRYLQLVNEDKWDSEEALALRETLDRWSQGREPALVRADMDIRVRNFRRKK
ncbi:MAG: AAA family ATPase [Succiniclasticum sp.]|nr:AAA family ATPase [Acidaminococcaceae bacterium]MBQ2221431.1 AAA family ATPase [Acidaminococcaceae bacterium]MEE3396382.1 AAA family ATPase [Succiniclasticum sp.]